MNVDIISSIAREAFLTIFLITAPFLFVALLVGVFISIIQAVTQIQDMSLTFVPKLFITGIIMFSMGGWVFSTLQNFTIRLLNYMAIINK